VEPEMRRKETANQRGARDIDSDVTLQHIVDGVEDELLVIDSKYRIRFANSAAQGRLQKGDESLVGRLCYEVFYDRDKPCSEPLWDCPLKEVLQSGSMTTVIHPVRVLGTDKYFKITAYPLRDSYGNPKAMVELRRDVTTERELETQVLRRQHQLLALSRVSAALSGLWDLDAILRVALDNMLDIMNGTIGGILLLDEETQMLSYRVHQGLSTRYVEEMHMSLGEGIAGRVAQSGKSTLLEDISADPRVAHPDLVTTEGLKAFISVPLRAKDKTLGVINIASRMPRSFTTDDMHLLHSIGDQLGVAIEEAKLYEGLRKGREMYRKLARQVLLTEEEERRRIARELHDETSQTLAALVLNLQVLIEMAETAGTQEPEFKARLKKTQSLAIQISTEVGRLIADLRPSALDTLGLIPAIRQYAETNLTSLGIDVSFEFGGMERSLPPEVELGLFRWAQGAIGNIIQHSQARHATISLKREDDGLVLCISDDGRGFDVSQITGIEESGRGAGLVSMKERLKLLGGDCSVQSQPGRGTTATATVPITWSTANAKDKSTSGR